MNKSERMIMAALEAGLKVLASHIGTAAAGRVSVAMARASSEIEKMPDPAPKHCSYCTVIGVDQMQQKIATAEADFKNFHRALCERFGYVHDEKDWRRDLLSLEEHLAKMLRANRPGGLRIDEFPVPPEPVTIDYTNYLGKRALRNIRPLDIRFAVNGNEYHPEPQWLLDAHDIDKDARRTFALRDIHAWGGAALMRAPAPGVAAHAWRPIIMTDGSVHPELGDELVALGWTPPGSWPDKANTKTVRYDLSAAEVEGELRDKLVAMGWTPPGVVDAAAAGAAAREAYDNTFHKVRAEVSFDWWGRIWLKALEWAGRAPPRVEESDLEILRKADARVGKFERLLEDIGLERSDGKLFINVKGDGHMNPIAEVTAPSYAGRLITTWMMRKQVLLHGESRPGHAEDAAAMMLAPSDDEMMRRFGDPANPANEESTWIEWDGSKRFGAWPRSPVIGVKVRVRFRDGDELETDAPEQMRWAWSRPYVSDADILAYRILS